MTSDTSGLSPQHLEIAKALCNYNQAVKIRRNNSDRISTAEVAAIRRLLKQLGVKVSVSEAREILDASW